MTKAQNNELKDFINNVCENNHLMIEKDLGDGYFLLHSQEAQKRQAAQDIKNSEDIIIELLRNSKDANAKNIFIATSLKDSIRNFTIIDDGIGIPKQHHKNIFKPYVTSKLNTMTKDIWGIHGRGMALYSIKTNSEDAYVVNSNTNLGCSIFVKSNITKLPEKKDQSTFPLFFINEGLEIQSRGPKNIIRTCCEFAIENRNKVNVYLGSYSEIASTIFFIYKNKVNIKYIFNEPTSNTPLIETLAYSADDKEFVAYAKRIGLNFSSRTARRIMNKQIKPSTSLLQQIINNNIKKRNFNANISNTNQLDKPMSANDIKQLITIKNKKTIKLNKEDKSFLTKPLKDNFWKIAEKYYLNKNIDPIVKIKNNKINISFSIEEIEQ